MSNISKERIAAISDGVIAVAATLLVIGLEVPEGAAMSNELIFHWSRVFAAWIISFIMVVVVWLDNHLFLSKARQWSLPLTIFTFLQLGAVSLIPFASNLVIDHYESRAAMLTFNAIMMLNGLISYAICMILSKDKNIIEDENVNKWLKKRAKRQLLVYILVLTFAISAGHFQHPFLGVILWALSPIIIAHLAHSNSATSTVVAGAHDKTPL